MKKFISVLSAGVLFIISSQVMAQDSCNGTDSCTFKYANGQFTPATATIVPHAPSTSGNYYSAMLSCVIINYTSGYATVKYDFIDPVANINPTGSLSFTSSAQSIAYRVGSVNFQNPPQFNITNLTRNSGDNFTVFCNAEYIAQGY